MKVAELRNDGRLRGCKLIPPYALEDVAGFTDAVIGALQDHYNFGVTYRRNGDGERGLGEVRGSDFSRTCTGEFVQKDGGKTPTHLGSLAYFCPTSPVTARFPGSVDDIEMIIVRVLENLPSAALASV
jgi:hypothetical protein